MTQKIDNEFFRNATVFDMSMRELEIFLTEFENFFKERQKKLKYESEYFEDLDEKFLFNKWFPNIQRRSFIISLVTIFENETRAYCNILNKYDKVKIKYSDLRGSAIEKFVNYTTKLAGINYNFDKNVFENIKALIELRNCIVHSDGIITDYQKKSVIVKFAKSFEGIVFENGHIYLSYKYCRKALNLISEFFNEIFKSGFYKYESSE